MVFPSVCDHLKLKKMKHLKGTLLTDQTLCAGRQTPEAWCTRASCYFVPRRISGHFLWSSSISRLAGSFPSTQCLASRPRSGEAGPAFPHHAMTCMYVHWKGNKDSIWPPSSSGHVLLPNLCAKILDNYENNFQL